jgi:hypothetical protein
MPPTPENAGYLVAAYVVAGVIYLGYVASLWRRARGCLAVNRER